MKGVKYLLVVVSGMGDLPLDALKGKTPLEAASTPNLDRVSSSGRIGLADLFEGDERAGSETALLSLLGLAPRGLAVARGPLEAAGIGVPLEADDLALRMNFVSVLDGVLVDHNAGQIHDAEAAVLVKMLNHRLGGGKAVFHAGLGYRNLLVLKGCGDMAFETIPPHEVLQQPVKDFYPYGADADLLVDLMEKAEAELADHDINKVRIDLGENPANMIWLWGQGRDFSLPSFSSLFPLKGCVVGAVPLIRGIAVKTGLDIAVPTGATGGKDTDFAAKARAALDALKRYDLVVLHVGAVNEACHESNPIAKVAAIEAVDSRLLGPLFEGLERLDRWRLLVAADHITSSKESAFVRGPVPVAFCGHEVEGIRGYPFTEAGARKSDIFIERGHNLMEFFLEIKRV